MHDIITRERRLIYVFPRESLLIMSASAPGLSLIVPENKKKLVTSPYFKKKEEEKPEVLTDTLKQEEPDDNKYKDLSTNNKDISEIPGDTSEERPYIVTSIGIGYIRVISN